MYFPVISAGLQNFEEYLHGIHFLDDEFVDTSEKGDQRMLKQFSSATLKTSVR
jgi:hypothetical protein